MGRRATQREQARIRRIDDPSGARYFAPLHGPGKGRARFAVGTRATRNGIWNVEVEREDPRGKVNDGKASMKGVTP